MSAEFSHYSELIAADPNLQDVTSLVDLHARLAELSAALTAAEPADSVFMQLTFPSEAGHGHPSPVFEPNRFKKDMSTEGVKIGQHYRYAIKDKEHVIQALEYACQTEPSLILPADEASGTGALLQGGYRCVGNLKFLRSHKVQNIVNTALNLGSFFVKFPTYVTAAEEDGITFLNLDWTDSTEQNIEADALAGACRLVHKARIAGKGVLVHCAQGKSRSATVTTAYVAALHGLPVEAALASVQQGRRMADPNPSFKRQLLALDQAGLFATLHAEWQQAG